MNRKIINNKGLKNCIRLLIILEQNDNLLSLLITICDLFLNKIAFSPKAINFWFEINDMGVYQCLISSINLYMRKKRNKADRMPIRI